MPSYLMPRVVCKWERLGWPAGGEVLATEAMLPYGDEPTVRLVPCGMGSRYLSTNRGGAMTHITVLVVDDELPILELLQEVLEDEGYAVVTATDGVTALELVRTVRPALVLTDIMLPRMDGLTLCAQLQADPQTAHLPVLLISAGRRPPPDVRCAGFVAKPFNVADLLAAVTRCVPRPPA